MDTLLHIGLANAAWATGLALVAALVGRLGRRPALAHGLWVIVLLKLVTPPFWSVSLPGPARVESLHPGAASPAGLADSGRFAPAEETAAVAEPGARQEGDRNGPGDTEPGPTPTEAAPSLPLPLSWTHAILLIWLTGSAAWFLLAGWRISRFRRLLRFAQSAPAEVQESVRRLAQGFGLAYSPGAWLVPGPVSPMLWAVLGRPRLLLPAALWGRLREEQRTALLAHELAHLRRRDHWVRRLELIATGLYWWHPVVWWARHAIERAEEECCDAWVVWMLPHAARSYALALLETVDFLSEVRCPLPPAVSGIGQVPFLRRRLAMILRGTAARRLSGPGFWALIGLGALVLPLLPGLGSDQPVAAAADAPPPAVTRGDGAPAQPPDRPRGREEAQPGPERPVDRTAPGRRAPGARQSSEELQNAKDEIELLEVQLEGKRAELQEVETRLRSAARHREILQKLSSQGSVSVESMDKAQDELDLAKAQLASKQVQVKEAEVRLKQAQRRLARQQPPPPTGRGGPSAGVPARPGDTASSASRRVEQITDQMKQLEQIRARTGDTTDAAKQIEAQLQRLRAERAQAEAEAARARRAPDQPRTEPTEDALKLRQEMEKAFQAKLDQFRAQVEEERRRAEQAMAAAEQARRLAEVKSQEAVKAEVLQKYLAEQQRLLAEALGEAKKNDSSAKLRALEQQLNALVKEMEVLRKEIRNLAPRPADKVPREEKK